MNTKSRDNMTDEEIQKMKVEIKELFKELIAEFLTSWIKDLNKAESSKDELQKISKRHKRGKW